MTREVKPTIDRIELPSEVPSGLSTVWANLFRAIARGIRGKWGRYDFTPTVTGSGNVDLFKVELRGTIVFVNISLSGGSGSGTISLPHTVEGNTAFSSYGCESVIALDNSDTISYSNASGDCVITGHYRSKEG